MSSIEQLHELAIRSGQDTYRDPGSGYQVLTRRALLNRGACCGNSCRHCPYGHINVAGAGVSQAPISEPVLLHPDHKVGPVDVLFWSGGKDSLLTLSHLVKQQRRVVLLTSFGALTHRVSIQDIHIKNIAKQSQFLKVPLCLVPLFPNTDYKKSIEAALDLIVAKTGAVIDRLVFGDLHLKDIRQWRVDTWAPLTVYTPLFEVPYDQLLGQLWGLQQSLGLAITLSTQLVIGDKTLPVGTAFDANLVLQLQQQGLDLMLENGEAHTLIFPRGASAIV